MSYRTNCKYCGKEKKIPAKMQKGVSEKTFMEDPYCSRDCCEADFAEQKEKAKTKKPRTVSGAKRTRTRKTLTNA